MKIIKIKTKTAEIEISKTELYALGQVFNEACHGIRIDNFEETISVPRSEAKQFLNYFKDLEKRTSPGSPIICKAFSEKPKQNKKSKEISRRKCCLCSKDYDLCFYIQEFPRSNLELNVIVALKRGDLTFALTDRNVILIEKLWQEITLLKEDINSFSQEIDFNTNYSFSYRAVHVNLRSTESDKSQLTIEFVFEPRRRTDEFDTPALNASNTTKSFTSVTTPDKITNFIADVEDFLTSIK